MRGIPATAGQLPRVIASYNAGPLPVARWAAINDKGDPLLWIESIPYWETRYYVPAVLRNMWVYQGLNNEHDRDPEGDGPAPLADLPDQHDARSATKKDLPDARRAREASCSLSRVA